VNARVSRPRKVLPVKSGVSKADLAGYYDDVAEAMRPHLARRPLVVHRSPGGVDRSGLHRTHVPGCGGSGAVNRRGYVRHFVADQQVPDVPRYLADQGCVEVHRWLARSDALDHPDLLVLDLDPPHRPDPGALRRAARTLRAVFEQLGVTPFLMTTGGRGYHVVAPLDCSAGFDEVRGLASGIAEHLAGTDPDSMTLEQRRTRRGRRILLDAGRNAAERTAVAPYSPRARDGAPVATPIGFDELGRVAPDGVDMRSVRRRLARGRDPWADFGSHASAPAMIRRALAELR
jgi:bifunctional non-homologous end joining protein LigD